MKKSFRILALMMVLMIGIGSFLAFSGGLSCARRHSKCRAGVMGEESWGVVRTAIYLTGCDASYAVCILTKP